MINANINIIGQRRGGGAFDPSSIANKVFWFDNRTQDMAADGSVWLDRVGGYDLAANGGGANPAFHASGQNGRPYFTIGGTATAFFKRAAIPGLLNAPKINLWAVGKRYAISQDAQDSPNQNRTNLLHHNADDNMYGQIFNNPDFGYGQKAFSNSINYSYMTFDGTQVGDDNRLKLGINSVQQSSIIVGTPIPALTHNNNTSVFSVGSLTTLGTLVPGDIYEAFGATGMTDVEIANMNAYLAAKYAI